MENGIENYGHEIDAILLDKSSLLRFRQFIPLYNVNQQFKITMIKK